MSKKDDNETGTPQPFGETMGEVSRMSVRKLPSERSAVSGESCSLMPTLERSVHWNKNFIKEDDPGTAAAAGTERAMAMHRTAAAESVQRLEGGCSELEKQLRDELRKRAGSTTSRLARVVEHASEQAKEDTKEDTVEARADVVQELQRQNAKLRRELEYLSKANDLESAVQHLNDVQEEIKSLEDIVGKLQDQVNERRAAHSKELQRRQAEVRRLVQQCEASREVVRALRKDNQALLESLEYVNKAQTQADRPVGDDLQSKLEKARGRLLRAERELEEKKHHPKKVAHSVESLRTLELVWSEHVALLEGLVRRREQWSLLRDRVEMFSRNIDILRVESEELKAKLVDVHAQLKEFVEQPMQPTAVVEKNVALLRHMVTIEATLSEKAVELDEQENGLMLEQSKVRELLVTLEGLRRENRHLNRRLEKFNDNARSPDDDRSRATVSVKGSSTASSRNKLDLTGRREALGSQNLSMFLIPRADPTRLHNDPPHDPPELLAQADPEVREVREDQGEEDHEQRPQRDGHGERIEGEASSLSPSDRLGDEDDEDDEDLVSLPTPRASPRNPPPSVASSSSSSSAASSMATAALHSTAPGPSASVSMVPHDGEQSSTPPASPR